MAITLDGSNGILSPDFEPSSSTLPTNGLYLPSANTLGLATNGTGKAFLDSAGNLGLGVTPSAWDSGYAILQAGSNGSAFGGRSAANTAYMMSNSVRSGSAWKYINTAATAQFQIENGAFYWFTAPSGTAGNAISFTQAMTLDASGQLMVGATSASGIIYGLGTSSNGYATISDGTGSILIGGSNAVTGGGVTGANAAIRTSGNLIFCSGGASERARIDSSGNLLVGTTSSAGSYLFQISGNFSGSYGQLVKSSASSGYMISFNTSSGQAGYISSSGTSTSYVASSDQRLKENIVDAPSALGSVNAIKVRSFDWKSDGSHVDYGYIAQELLEVVPEAVSVHEDPEQMMGVDFGKLTPRLVKAIQELTARLEALEAK